MLIYELCWPAVLRRHRQTKRNLIHVWMRMLFTVFGAQTGQLIMDDLHVKDVWACGLIALIYVKIL